MIRFLPLGLSGLVNPAAQQAQTVSSSIMDITPAQAINLLDAREGNSLELVTLRLRQELRRHDDNPITVDYLNASLRTLTDLLDETSEFNPKGRSNDPGLRAEARETLRLMGSNKHIIGVLDPERVQRAYHVLAADIVNLEGVDKRLVPYITHVMALFGDNRVQGIRKDIEAGRIQIPSQSDSASSATPALVKNVVTPSFQDLGISELTRLLTLGLPRDWDEIAIVQMRRLFRANDAQLDMPGVATTAARELFKVVQNGVEMYDVKRLTSSGFEATETLRRLALSPGWRNVAADLRDEMFKHFAVLSGEINSGLGPYLEHVTLLFHPKDSKDDINKRMQAEAT